MARPASTGGLIARDAQVQGHQPVLAGRSAPTITAVAESLGLPHQALALDDMGALHAALADVDLVLNVAGPFLRTAGPLAEACINAGSTPARLERPHGALGSDPKHLQGVEWRVCLRRVLEAKSC